MSLYPPPEMCTAEVFCRLPDEYRRPGVENEWSKYNRAGVDCFLEGPSFDTHGNLYVVDIPFGRIFKIDPAGQFSLVCEYDGWPNGLKIHEDGRIFVADYKNGIMLVDPEKGSVEPILKGYNSEGFKGCNDLHFAADGCLYFTDQGQTGLSDPTGRVFRWNEKTDQLDCLIDCAPSPQWAGARCRGKKSAACRNQGQRHLAGANPQIRNQQGRTVYSTVGRAVRSRWLVHRCFRSVVCLSCRARHRLGLRCPGAAYLWHPGSPRVGDNQLCLWRQE